MEAQHNATISRDVVYAFLGGAVLGIGAALLLAPKSGRETRSSLRGYVGKVEDEVAAKMQDIKSALDCCHRMVREHVERGQEHLKREDENSCCG